MCPLATDHEALCSAIKSLTSRRMFSPYCVCRTFRYCLEYSILVPLLARISQPSLQFLWRTCYRPCYSFCPTFAMLSQECWIAKWRTNLWVAAFSLRGSSTTLLLLFADRLLFRFLRYYLFFPRLVPSFQSSWIFFFLLICIVSVLDRFYHR